jgi:glycosyltransferase involved in cell wall biosynthesis
MLRVLLIYQFFGPYHIARFRHWSSKARERNWEPLGMQLFQRPDLYNWSPSENEHGFVNLALTTAGGDAMQWRDMRRFTDAMSELQPDVVIVNGWGMRDAIIAHLWCRLHRVPRVLVSDSQGIDFDRRWLKERIKQVIIKGCGSAFVAGTPHRRYAVDLGIDAEKITEGCDVVDNEHFSSARKQRVTNGYRILTVARWSPEKNLIAAAQAFLQFLKTRPNSEPWIWKLVGYGSQGEQLKEYASESGGRIELLGAKKYDELPSTFAQADLYWQPSLRDPWALAVNEAMASGLPVLVSNRCGCHQDLVTSDNGWTFDPTCVEAMTKALMEAGASHQRWSTMGDASARVIEDWGLPRFSDGLNEAARLAVQGVLPCE